MENLLSMRYPIGIQDFKTVRQNDYYYADKTALLYKLVKGGQFHFLSRPRRFGKSLLVSMMECYFKGERELFKGLAIDQLEKEWLSYPVLHLDLNAEKYTTPEALASILNRFVSKWECIYGKDESEDTLSARFAGVVERYQFLHQDQTLGRMGNSRIKNVKTIHNFV